MIDGGDDDGGGDDGLAANADINASAVMVVMVMPDHNLGGPSAGALCQTLIVGFQQR